MNHKSKRNEHTIDRALRVVVGLILFSLVFVGPKTLWGLFGLVPLLTGLAGTCPVYSVLGLSTCSSGKSKAANTA